MQFRLITVGLLVNVSLTLFQIRYTAMLLCVDVRSLVRQEMDCECVWSSPSHGDNSQRLKSKSIHLSLVLLESGCQTCKMLKT